MPYIHIDWITQSSEKRDEVSKRVASAVNEVTGIALNDIWVVFKDVDADNWYVGDRSVAKIRAEAKK
jgi:4-oxalocrotonate tautomerase